MAKVEFKGIDEVVTSLTELSELPDEVICSGAPAASRPPL